MGHSALPDYPEVGCQRFGISLLDALQSVPAELRSQRESSVRPWA